ncbi:RagB/SusD family nutrient uptake outer membrane protein [Ochrovirga pacifica]|uniref:RagB/SusD family nutrient uptake outer membrane protein n=1 Tax=Ochrovirga pacifica TaxID=1042376 RepID=UPI0002559FD5|nr:RagB/SusD family nutrient uptake outer membrane protein [Ochrovirga pacifica]
MKNTIYKIQKNILLFLGLFLCVSCEDFLEETSSATITASSQFDTETGFKDALIGVYIGMTQPELYSKDLSFNLIDILSRQYEPLTSNALYSQAQNFNYRGTLATAQIDALWIKSYNIIANINSALEAIDNKQDVLGTVNYALIKGELLGLRAFLHFDLLRLYGLGNLNNRSSLDAELTIPYVQDFSKNVTSPKNYTTTFQLLEQDLEEALMLLEEDPIYTQIERSDSYYTEVNRTGFYNHRELRMNYYAVKALQARVMLWKGGTEDLETARLAAEEVMQYVTTALINAQTYPVASDPLLYPEILFGLNVTDLGTTTVGILNAATTDTNYNALYLSQGTADEVYETSNVNIGVADIRYNTLLEGQTRGLVSTKLIQKSGILNPEIVPLIKLPEMYYIAAEARIQSGSDLATAVNYLNTVRSSRGIIEEIPASATQEELKLELEKEYRKEFVGEGQLFFYYKRLGYTTFPGIGDDVVVDDAIYVLPYPDTEL